jgi:hypothetical protein
LKLGIPSGDAGEVLFGRLRALRDLTLAEHRTLPRAIESMTTVKVLRLAGPIRDIERLRALTGVVELSLISVTLPGLDPLVSMPGLRTFRLILGGTHNLEALSELANLERLELSWVRGLADLSVLARLVHLRTLDLDRLKQVTTLPSFSPLAQLNTVYLQRLRGLTDLSPIAQAPALEKLWLIDASHLEPEAVLPLAGHPKLRELRAGFGSLRKNRRARQLLGLPASD